MSRFLEIVRDSVSDVRKRLRDTYCVDGGSSSTCRGKKRLLKYAGNVDAGWEDIRPLIANAINIKVVVVPPADLSSRWGVHDMGYFDRKNPPQISIVSNLPSAYAKRYGTTKGFKKFVRYVLFHEFGHALDHALNVTWNTGQSSGKYTKDIGGIVSGGEGRESYFNIGTEYGRRELFAEWSALQDLVNSPFDLDDMKYLCFIKQKYPKRDRIKIKAERGYEVTELDHAVQSKLIQSILNCADLKETLKRLNSMGLKTK